MTPRPTKSYHRRHTAIRALYRTWFEGWTPEDDAVLEDRLSAVFERQGWVKLESMR